MQLRTSPDPQLYQRAAHDNAPEEVWLDVINRYPGMKVWVAHNKTVPRSILSLLADDTDEDVRLSVAMKRNAGPTVLERLAHDMAFSVRHRVAYNAKAPIHVLEILAMDQESEIAAVAEERIRALNDCRA